MCKILDHFVNNPTICTCYMEIDEPIKRLYSNGDIVDRRARDHMDKCRYWDYINYLNKCFE